ncbi:MAG: hypothetical protein E7339_01830 [Clostridiales bacterium]|nr:hypothetical protein [Clostridiales bacterium]
MIVCKFGGTSVASKTALAKVKEIIDSNSERKIIVLSAIGKESTNDIKLTDLLINAYRQAGSQAFISTYNRLKNKMITFATRLDINPHNYFNFELFKRQIEYSSVNYDYILSRGEYFTAKICATALNLEFIDAINLIKKDHLNRINISKVANNLKKYTLDKKYVIPGFYCLNASGEISLLERGGSDTTGAIVATAANATVYENYSDVNGLLTIDNKISLKAKTIKELSLPQLTHSIKDGANVFCLGAIPYIYKFKGELQIKNTFLNNDNFTLIDKQTKHYYFDHIKEYACISQKEKTSKKRFISNIFNIIMTNKIDISEAFYLSSTIFLRSANSKLSINKKLVDGIKLTLYSYSNDLTLKIKKIAKDYKVTVAFKSLPAPYLKYKFYFFGKITKNFINEIIEELERKNTPL